jgi:ceramide glucosyltransferase
MSLWSVTLPVLALSALLAGSLVYCVLTVAAARRYLAAHPGKLHGTPPISILKPLAGVDEGLEDNLRSFFEQDYPAFEILFAVRTAADGAAEVVRRLQACYPRVHAHLLVTGEPPYPNPKVFSLDCMFAESRHDLLVMSDSDVRIGRRALQIFAAEFQDEHLGLATCPYRAVPGGSFWSTLEAIGLNTEFLGGVLVARMLEGMKFALGPTIAARKETLLRIGGFATLKDYLAEDFVMGKLAAEAGYGVILSSYLIEHRIGSQAFRANLHHRLRWSRSTRRSRPLGYIGQVFTNPLTLALLVFALRPEWWPVLVVAATFRAAAAWAVAGRILHDPLTCRRWWLVPLQDVAGFLVWIAGFFGNTVLWRGREYYVRADGRYELLHSRLES